MPSGIAPSDDAASRRFAARRRSWPFILKQPLRATPRRHGDGHDRDLPLDRLK